jgi:hypothetical protein
MVGPFFRGNDTPELVSNVRADRVSLHGIKPS